MGNLEEFNLTESLLGGSDSETNGQDARSGRDGISTRQQSFPHPGSARLAVPPPARHVHSVMRGRKTAWIALDLQGQRRFLYADKRAVIAQLNLNVPIRDMRLLDFNLFSSGKILVRDNAVLFSMEHVRLVVGADVVLIPHDGYGVGAAAPLVDRLSEAIRHWNAVRVREAEAAARGEFAEDEGRPSRRAGSFVQREKEAGTSVPASYSPSHPGVMEPSHLPARVAPQGPSSSPGMARALSGMGLRGLSEEPEAGWGSLGPDGPDEDASSSAFKDETEAALPFELVVLETALRQVISTAHAQAKELESVALPALDALAKHVSSAGLERVRKLKTRHQRLLIRCETLRDEMERFLEDDEDMLKMCLTRRKELEQAAMERAQTLAVSQGMEQAGSLSAHAHRQASHVLHLASSLSRRSPFALRREGAARWGVDEEESIANALRSPLSGPGTQAAGLQRASGGGGPALPEEDLLEDMEAVENLLESYYVQVDVLYDKVVSLDEYIKDTEEYINIHLDSSRNQLIKLDILLTAAAFAIAPFNLMAGILGENLVIPEFLTGTVDRFYAVNALAAVFCMLGFSLFLSYMRRRKLV